MEIYEVGDTIKFKGEYNSIAIGRIIFRELIDYNHSRDNYLVHIEKVVSGEGFGWSRYKGYADTHKNCFLKDYNDEDKFWYVCRTEIIKNLRKFLIV